VAKYAALTVRKLKPGTYDEWRQAWKADPWPQGVQAYILRNLDDSDEIIAFGLTDRDADELRSDPQLQQQQRERQDAMAPFVESIGADGFYEVIDEVTG
jgi:hypothetical protein